MTWERCSGSSWRRRRRWWRRRSEGLASGLAGRPERRSSRCDVPLPTSPTRGRAGEEAGNSSQRRDEIPGLRRQGWAHNVPDGLSLAAQSALRVPDVVGGSRRNQLSHYPSPLGDGHRLAGSLHLIEDRQALRLELRGLESLHVTSLSDHFLASKVVHAGLCQRAVTSPPPPPR